MDTLPPLDLSPGTQYETYEGVSVRLLASDSTRIAENGTARPLVWEVLDPNAHELGLGNRGIFRTARDGTVRYYHDGEIYRSHSVQVRDPWAGRDMMKTNNGARVLILSRDPWNPPDTNHPAAYVGQIVEGDEYTSKPGLPWRWTKDGEIISEQNGVMKYSAFNWNLVI